MKKVTRYAEVVSRLEVLEESAKSAATKRALRLSESDTYRRLNRAGRVNVTVRVPAVTAKTAAPTLYVHSWGASYVTGGEEIASLETLVPGFVAAIPSPGNGYTFTWDHATTKLKAFSAAGTEVAGATNLATAVGTTPILVYGVQPSIMDVFQADGGETVTAVRVFFERSVALSSTNFWTIEARIRAADEEYGRALVSIGDAQPALSNKKRSFVGGQSETLYEAVTGAGRRLSSADRIVVYASPATQSCLPLGDLTVSVEMQRKVI